MDVKRSHGILPDMETLYFHQAIVIWLFQNYPDITSDQVHNRTNAKLFMRELPIPLIPHDTPDVSQKLSMYKKFPELFSLEGLTVQFEECNDLFCQFNTKAPNRGPQGFSEKEIAGNCLIRRDINSLEYIESDGTTNGILINFALNAMAKANSLPKTFVSLLWAGVYDVEGYTMCMKIYEDFGLWTIGSYYLASSDELHDILRQVSIGLHMLHNYVGLVHGACTVSNFHLKTENIEYEYNGIAVNSSLSCKLGNFSESSCMIETTAGTKLRFYQPSLAANLALAIDPFDFSASRDQNGYHYRLNHLLDSSIFFRLRHMGIPYYKTIDYYTIMISILLDPVRYKLFFSNKDNVDTFWVPMWKNERDGIKMYTTIGRNIGTIEPDDMNGIFDILRGFDLSCDALDRVMEGLIRTSSEEQDMQWEGKY